MEHQIRLVMPQNSQPDKGWAGGIFDLEGAKAEALRLLRKEAWWDHAELHAPAGLDRKLVGRVRRDGSYQPAKA
jgi:hypothetical protein